MQPDHQDARPSAASPPRIVAVSGNVRRPSRTAAVVESVATEVAGRFATSPDLFDMVDAAGDILSALTPQSLSARGHHTIARVVAADILIVGSPIYRATYTGALKHLFDLIDYRALRGAVGIVALTGGTPLHALAAEQAMRNMMGFFGILPLPTAIFALDTDFDGTRPRGAELHDRIARAADEAAALTGGWSRPRLELAA